MSRSGYSDDCDNIHLYRRAVERALAGKRGQSFLRELVTALEALPEKKLIEGDLEYNGTFCALGAVGRLRGIDITQLDQGDHEQLGKVFGIARTMIAEIEFENDEFGLLDDGKRYEYMLRWAKSELGEL